MYDMAMVFVVLRGWHAVGNIPDVHGASGKDR